MARAGGQLDDGVYDFEIPLDSTVESVYFFISLQCLQFVTVVQPSGDDLRIDAPEVDYHAFEAIRLFTIKAPRPGTWKVRMAGRGFFSVIVKAKTDLALTGVSFVQDGVPVRGLAPLGKAVRLEAALTGQPRQVGFHFISMRAAVLQTVEMALEQEGAMRRTVRCRRHAAHDGVSSSDDRNRRGRHSLPARHPAAVHCRAVIEG